MGPGTGWVGRRVVPLPAHPPTSPPRVHPSLPRTHADTLPGYTRGLKVVVGLKSVGQLSLVAHISDIGTMTEVYNLVEIGRIINHSVIPGTE